MWAVALRRRCLCIRVDFATKESKDEALCNLSVNVFHFVCPIKLWTATDNSTSWSNSGCEPEFDGLRGSRLLSKSRYLLRYYREFLPGERQQLHMPWCGRDECSGDLSVTRRRTEIDEFLCWARMLQRSYASSVSRHSRCTANASLLRNHDGRDRCLAHGHMFRMHQRGDALLQRISPRVGTRIYVSNAIWKEPSLLYRARAASSWCVVW